MWNKTILIAVMEWDYGKKERGESIEKRCFFNTLKKLVTRVEPFWIDDYLKDKSKLQAEILARTNKIHPDLIFFIPYKDEFTFETLDRLKQNSSTFAWYGDDQWRFDSFSSKYAPHYSFVSTTDPWSVMRYKKIGVEPILSQWAAHSFSDDQALFLDKEIYEYDVTFVGGSNASRKWFVNELQKRGVSVDCFGSGWANGRVSNEQMEEIFRRSRINLNLSNSISYDLRFITSNIKNLYVYLRSSKHAEQIKARNFEIPLAGGFQLSNYVLGLERYLHIGEEIAVFTSPEECAKQIEYYLNNEEERKKILKISQKRVAAEHTYQHRLGHILKSIWSKEEG